MKNFKKLLALVLVLVMALAVMPVMTASAAAPETLYLTPNANWKSDGARFAAYFFGNGETWVSMTDSDGDGVYEVAVPAGYPNVIFCRMNPNASANNWNNKWNQTADLTVPTDGPNHYTIKEGSWDAGSWSTFGSTCMHTNLGEAATCTTAQKCLDCGDPVVAELGHTYNTAHLCTRCNEQATFTVAGSGAHMNGEWAPANTANDMTYADGVYTKVYTNVAAGSYKLKVARDHDWGTAYPSADKAYTVATSGSTVTVTLKGETVTIDVAAPHVHDFVEGKCECGEIDPDYVATHVNALVVGDTNKIVVSGKTLNDFGLPIEWVGFVAEEDGFYSFVGDNGALAFIFTAEGALVNATGAANLEAGSYLICLGNGAAGEFNVAVTKAAWVNALAADTTSKIYVDGSILNDYSLPIAWVAFTVTEKANYSFACAEEGAMALIFDSANNYIGVAGELEAGDYLICVGGGVVGYFNVTVTKTAISEGGDNPVETPTHDGEQEFVLGENTVIIDGCTVNGAGTAVEMVKFVVTEKGVYKFTSDSLKTYISTSTNPSDVSSYVCGFTGVAELEPGTYYICCGNNGVKGEFTVTATKEDGEVELPHINTMVVGDNHYVISDTLFATGFEFITIEITEPGVYTITGGAPMKVYMFTVLAADVVADSPFGWNVDGMEASGFAPSFEVTLAEAGTYMMGFNYEYVTEEREFDINISFKEALPEDEPTDVEPAPQPEMNFFQKIIALLMQLIDMIKKLLGM